MWLYTFLFYYNITLLVCGVLVGHNLKKCDWVNCYALFFSIKYKMKQKLRYLSVNS